MVLGDGLIDKEGERHEMAGLLPISTSFEKRKRHLGYRTFTLKQPCPLGPKGTTFRGHEFHYASVIGQDESSSKLGLFNARDARGDDKGEQGLIAGSVAGSFLHVIDRVVEPSDEDFRTTGPLRVIKS